jgi:hypothetical protein
MANDVLHLYAYNGKYTNNQAVLHRSNLVSHFHGVQHVTVYQYNTSRPHFPLIMSSAVFVRYNIMTFPFHLTRRPACALAQLEFIRERVRFIVHTSFFVHISLYLFVGEIVGFRIQIGLYLFV